MVKFILAKDIFSHTNANFHQAYEGASEKGRRRCFATNNAILEIWKEKNKNRPLVVKTNIKINS